LIQRRALAAGIFILACGTPAAAQEAGYRVVSNPFQDDFGFVINTDLRPLVEIAGVRWTRFGMHVKGEREIKPDKEMPVTVELEFFNTNADGVRILVVALLEDADGHPIERLECDRVRASSDRLKESVQKFKISGTVLQTMRRVYLFCEIEQ
jgi:hypothetical protein